MTFHLYQHYISYPELSHCNTIWYDDVLIVFKELPAHVGFRLGALREVCEETGLMIDRKSGVFMGFYIMIKFTVL